MGIYEKETNKKAIWRGNITESFKKWQRGEKVYIDNKERICILASEDIKSKWQDFAAKNNISTLSKLIRESVEFYMTFKSKKFDFENISNITHYLKEPLTSIKGFSEILIEDHKHELNWDILLKIRNIFDESIILEERIESLSIDKITEGPQYDILIVDDDPSTIRLLTDYFERKGYICENAIDGETALEKIKVFTPKLILLDIILPNVNGYDVCKKIKSNAKIKNVSIYYITAVPPLEVKEQIKETGADGYFLKPFKIKDFDVLFSYL
ncbi:hypothetical protein LCGC14_0492060 [marine sediment metagenome]|uniref:Response regulatory domain-containing protein n=1 Tax=marine sediment metagenome TaxID=412755 RepID=A0A0F9UTA3_9ZZZZ|nr:MAG: Signal transduction response regulator [Candidatus Lokiarchaeum sp. GC14_75]HEA71205.1 hybrid sensor histidine kinase/response regulator [archaeon]